MTLDRRSFLRVAGFGGLVFASGLSRGADPYKSAADEFYFVQLSDTHWGFQGPPNPDAAGTLPKAVAAVFPLYPQWDWATKDGEQAIAILMPHHNVTVFYGHIHQEHHFKTGHIEHHSAKSLIFPLPAPGSQAKRAPIAWDPAQPYRGLGFREVEGGVRSTAWEIEERPVVKA